MLGDEAEREDELETRRQRPAAAKPAPAARQPDSSAPAQPPIAPPTRDWLAEPDKDVWSVNAIGARPAMEPTIVAPPRARITPPPAAPLGQTLAGNFEPALALPPRAIAPPRPGDRYPTEPAYATRESRAVGSGCAWVGALVVVIVAACGLLLYGAISNGFAGLSGMVPSFPGLPLVTPTTIIATNRPAVIEQIRPLGRLETSQYTIEKVIPGESTGPLPPLTSDKILFVAHGDVVAGVDLQKMSDSDVIVSEGVVTITLPAAEILVTRLDNDKSYVYDRQTGFFTKSDPNLESNVRRIAEGEITKAALEGGILQKAQSGAEDTLRTLILALGYEQVIFHTQDAPASSTATP